MSYQKKEKRPRFVIRMCFIEISIRCVVYIRVLLRLLLHNMHGGIGDLVLVEVCVSWSGHLVIYKKSTFRFRCVIFVRGFVRTLVVLFA